MSVNHVAILRLHERITRNIFKNFRVHKRFFKKKKLERSKNIFLVN